MEDYEKKYKSAMEAMRQWIAPCYTQEQLNVMKTSIFPELKESEDEKIRKSLIEHIKGITCWNFYFLGISREQMISWLEKQGEKTNPYSGVSFEYNGHVWGMCARDNGVDILLDKQLFKHLDEQCEQKTDKVEPKFKVGDWIINSKGMLRHIVDVDKTGYQTDDGWLTHDDYEKNFHLWTIQDAKNGDVLVCNAQCHGEKMEEVGIYKEYIGRHGGCSNSFKIYAGIDWDKNLLIDNIMGSSEIYPATKEQRDTLMKVIADAGYRWNKEELKLEKI